METYEKKYKDAQKWIESIYTELTHERQMEAEAFFPELKESEDERIRRWCISHFKECINVIKNNDEYKEYLSNKVIAWLEKQGEHKEYTFKSLPRLLDMIEPTSRAKAYCQKLIDSLVKEGYSTDAKIVGECLKKMNGEKVSLVTMDENQGAPKTTKGIFEVWKDMRCEVYAQASGNRHEPNCSDNTTKLFSLNDIDELIEKLSEQKPAWSEKDKDLMYNTLSNLTELKDIYGEEYGKVGKCIAWIKSLKEKLTETKGGEI